MFIKLLKLIGITIILMMLPLYLVRLFEFFGETAKLIGIIISFSLSIYLWGRGCISIFKKTDKQTKTISNEQKEIKKNSLTSHNNEYTVHKSDEIIFLFTKFIKKLIIPMLLLFVLVLVGYIMFVEKDAQSIQQQPENQTKEIAKREIVKKEITRKDELQLEGFINDYFYRKQIKDSFLFGDFDAYGSVLFKSIVIYVYPKNTLSQGKANDIKRMIEDGLQSTLFDFSDFEWAKEYSFDVVVR